MKAFHIPSTIGRDYTWIQNSCIISEEVICTWHCILRRLKLKNRMKGAVSVLYVLRAITKLLDIVIWERRKLDWTSAFLLNAMATLNLEKTNLSFVFLYLFIYFWTAACSVWYSICILSMVCISGSHITVKGQASLHQWSQHMSLSISIGVWHIPNSQ